MMLIKLAIHLSKKPAVSHIWCFYFPIQIFFLVGSKSVKLVRTLNLIVYLDFDVWIILLKNYLELALDKTDCRKVHQKQNVLTNLKITKKKLIILIFEILVLIFYPFVYICCVLCFTKVNLKLKIFIF